MADAQLDLSSLQIDDASNEDRHEAVAHITSILKKENVFPEWIKEPPDWWVFAYLVDPQTRRNVNELAFERIECRPGWYKAVHPLMFTHMLIIGRVDDLVGYSDRWCYKDFDGARQAMLAWNGQEGTEPDGWHRHPNTGRRRELQDDGTWKELTERY